MRTTNAIPPISDKLLQEFVDLATQLSPEWLTCDGECSTAEINRRYAKLMREWRALERKAGRAVTEDDEGASLTLAPHCVRCSAGVRCPLCGQRVIVAPSWAWKDACCNPRAVPPDAHLEEDYELRVSGNTEVDE